MKKVAVLGLGIMGRGIADNFLKHGYDVIVWNRSADRAAELVDKGARVAVSVADAVKDADMVFEVTANDESSRSVWLGAKGVMENSKPDAVLITCATLSVAWVDELAAACEKAGRTFFDMPMTGGRQGAESGQLILLAGGDESKLASISTELEVITAEVKYFGPAGSGMRFKLVLNALQAVHIAGFGEAMRLAHAMGLDEKKTGDALAERPGGVSTNIAWRDYQTEPSPINFSVEWIAKDLGYALANVDDDSNQVMRDTLKAYTEAIKRGESDEDWTAINRS